MKTRLEGGMYSRVSKMEIGGLLSLLIVFFIGQVLLFPDRLVGPDTKKYVEIAEKQLLDGFWADPGAFGGNYWPIGYPTFLGLLARVSNDTDFILVVQAVMAVALVAIGWGLAFRLGARARMTTAVLIAANVSIWGMARTGGYEILLSLLLTTALLLLCTSLGDSELPRVDRSVILGFSSGLLMGLAILVQNKAVVLLAVTGYLAFRMGKPALASHLGGVLLALVPWSLRNQAIVGSWSPFNSNGPVNIWIGNNPDNITGGFMDPPPLPKNSAGFLDAAWTFLISQPEAGYALLLRRVVRLLEPNYIYPEQLPIPIQVGIHFWSIAVTGVLYLLLITFLFGWLWKAPRRPVGLDSMAMFVLLFYSVHLPFLAEARYMAPLIPPITVIAVATFFTLIRRGQPSLESSSPGEKGKWKSRPDGVATPHDEVTTLHREPVHDR